MLVPGTKPMQFAAESFQATHFYPQLRKISHTKTSEAPLSPFMTPLARRKVITAKRSLPVVAGNTAKGLRGCMVIQRLGRTNLESDGGSHPHLMTFITS
jgi:hypothetical protein